MSHRPIILDGWCRVPHEIVGGRGELANLKDRLTFKPRFADEDEGPVYLFEDDPANGYIAVPRAFGMHRWEAWPKDDRRSLGQPMLAPSTYRMPDPNHPNVKEPEKQAQFMADLAEAMQSHSSLIASAPTGSGKTIVGSGQALTLGRKTLILVHLERLMYQWIEDALIPILGVPEARIGIAQGPTCDYADKDFVVGMLHSTILKDYPADFYQSFGTVIADEVHKIGSRFFAQAIPQFPAKYRLGLSATPKRKDGGDRSFFWHVGPVRVQSEAAALPMRVIVLPYACPNPKERLWGRQHGARMKALSLDPDRNERLASVIFQLWRKKRKVLIVADSVRHVQTLMALAEKWGVPRAEMGQYTRQMLVQKNGQTRQVRRKKEDLDKVKAESDIIFATYGMMTEGVDIPRLDAGVDATPRGSATQLIGRIRRPQPGKPTPVWVTLWDTECPMATRYLKSRVKDYQTSGNVEVVRHGA